MIEPDAIWTEGGLEHRARWRSESAPVPRRIAVVDDRTRADSAFRLAAEGSALLYRGDFHNARQLLTAITHRVKHPKQTGEPTRDFNLYRQARGREAQLAGRLLVELAPDFSIPLRRAPDVREALGAAWEPHGGPQLAPLREVLGAVGAHQWRTNGVEVAALGGRVHPHYGVFAPIRSEYVALVAQAPLGPVKMGWDIGTGTGVLALVLARRCDAKIVATDADERALACARENVARFGLGDRIEVRGADLWPDDAAVPTQHADVIVCNPPWLPGRPTSRMERAIYDRDGSFLQRFIAELGAHLAPGGEGWLVISDLAERLGLRSPTFLAERFDAAGLMVRGTLCARPSHPRVSDSTDVFHAARADEQTTLYRLAPR